MTIEIRRLTPALLDDWLRYFDHDVFCDNDEWCGCYCMCCHWNQSLNKIRTWKCGRDDAVLNRAQAVSFIEAGLMQGYLAYADGKVVGWCNANDMTVYDNDIFCPARAIPDGGEKVKSVVCFNVAPDYRHHGIATLLLERVCLDAKAEGYALVEGYPFVHDEHHACHGPLALYAKCGFSSADEIAGCRVMRRMLKKGAAAR